MARRSRKKSRETILFLRNIIIAVFVLFIVLFSGKRVVKFFKYSRYFSIKDIIIDENLGFINAKHLSRVKGKNIFRINLAKIQKDLRYRYPKAAKLKVLRRFPDSIEVVAKKRNVTAQIEMNGSYVVLSEEGVVVEINGSSKASVPFIKGVEVSNSNIKIGRTLHPRSMKTALKVIRIIKKQRVLSGYKVKKVDVGSLSKILIYFRNNFKLIINNERVESQIKTAELVLSKGKLASEQVSYVDVRFKEPIVGKK